MQQNIHRLISLIIMTENLIYDKKQCTIEDQENRMLNVSAMLIDMLVLFISIIFILLEKISSDYEALELEVFILLPYRNAREKTKRKYL